MWQVVRQVLTQAWQQFAGQSLAVLPNGELAAGGAPDLHVDLRPIEGRLVGDLDEGHLAMDHRLADHVLRLVPKAHVVDVLHSETSGVVGAQAHDVLLDPEDAEVL